MSEDNKLFRRHFFAFLKENDAYDKWIHNLFNRHPIDDINWWDNYNQLLYGNKYDKAITYAFIWDETKEGYQFWDNLNNEWIIKLSTLTVPYDNDLGLLLKLY